MIWQDSCIYVHQWYWSVISFPCVIFVWHWYQGNGGLIKWAWECPFLCNVLEDFQKHACYLISKFLIEFPLKQSGPGLLTFGRFLITVSISILVIGLFIFSVSSWLIHKSIKVIHHINTVKNINAWLSQEIQKKLLTIFNTHLRFKNTLQRVGIEGTTSTY